MKSQEPKTIEEIINGSDGMSYGSHLPTYSKSEKDFADSINNKKDRTDTQIDNDELRRHLPHFLKLFRALLAAYGNCFSLNEMFYLNFEGAIDHNTLRELFRAYTTHLCKKEYGVLKKLPESQSAYDWDSFILIRAVELTGQLS